MIRQSIVERPYHLTLAVLVHNVTEVSSCS